MTSVVKLIKILLGSLVVFLVIAMIQQWHVFKPWILREKTPAPSLSAGERKAIETMLDSYLSMLAHFHGAGGDPRFGERLPAAPWLVEEMRREAAYARTNGRRQILNLVKVEVGEIERLADDRARVSTKEYWVIRTLRLDGQGEADPPRSELLYCSYGVRRENQSWQVVGWDVVDPSRTQEAGSQRPEAKSP